MVDMEKDPFSPLTDQERKNILEQLTRMRVLLVQEERWQSGRLASDANSHDVDPRSHRAVCFCLVGAALAVSTPPTAPQLLRVLRYVQDKYYPYCAELEDEEALIEWNDGVADLQCISDLLEKARAEISSCRS